MGRWRRRRFCFNFNYCIFSRRALARIADYFEETLPLYHDDVFRSHFRMTPSSFETLCQLLVQSDHIPKGNVFGWRCIDPEKQIAVAVWALANQESCRQISDRFNVTMSSVARCIRRVTKALVDLRGDLIQWPRGNPSYYAWSIKHRSKNQNILNILK